MYVVLMLIQGRVQREYIQGSFCCTPRIFFQKGNSFHVIILSRWTQKYMKYILSKRKVFVILYNIRQDFALKWRYIIISRGCISLYLFSGCAEYHTGSVDRSLHRSTAEGMREASSVAVHTLSLRKVDRRLTRIVDCHCGWLCTFIGEWDAGICRTTHLRGLAEYVWISSSVLLQASRRWRR